MTQIPYIDETWNPITGCSGKACKCHDTCWARDMVRRFPAIHAGSNLLFDPYNRNRPVNFDVAQFHPDRLDKPLHWRKPRRIGVSFIGDLFDEQIRGSWLYSIYPVMVEADWHTYFVLTKQVKRMAQWISDTKNAWKNRTSHIYHGVSICDQEDADTKIPDLLRIPGHKWISVEPMLSAINIDQYLFQQCTVQYDGAGEEDWGYDVEPRDNGIEFAIIGCESGSKRRPCDQKAMTQLVTDLQDAFVPVWVKQIQNEKGRIIHDINLFPEALKVRQIP